MASIYKRKEGKGWRAVIRKSDHPTICKQFERKQQAIDWATQVEREILLGQFNFDQYKNLHTFNELLENYVQEGILEHHKSSDDTRRHLNYWRSRLGSYGVTRITTDLLRKERQLLLETPTDKGRNRSPSTVNRYVSSLSALLSYASNQLDWIKENPALRLKKLKENRGRDRVLSYEEISQLLPAAKQSKSPYLYCIILLSLTTGARQGEILNLEWKDIDFNNKLAFIRETKNGNPRSVPLCDPVFAQLKHLYQYHNPHKSLVFASKTAFGRIDIKKAWQNALTRAGIKNCRFHDMRHTFCTYAASRGASNLQLATATGHKTLAMLMHYTHMDVEVTKQFSNQISDQILKGSTS